MDARRSLFSKSSIPLLCKVQGCWPDNVASSSTIKRLSRPAGARPFPVTDAPFGLDARDVKLTNREFAPREGAALVAIKRRDLPRELRQRRFCGAHAAIERHEVFGDLRHKGRNCRLDDFEHHFQTRILDSLRKRMRPPQPEETVAKPKSLP